MKNVEIWSEGKRPTPAFTRVMVVTLINLVGTALIFAYQLIFLTGVVKVSLTTAGTILGLMSGAAIVTAPLGGTLADKFGALSVMVWGFFVAALGYFVFAWAKTATVALVSGIVIGMATATSWSTSTTLVADLTTPQTRARAFSLHRMAINGAFGVGGIIGGLVASVEHPLRFRLLFVADAVSFLLAIVLCIPLRGYKSKRSGPARPTTLDPAALDLAATADPAKGTYRDVFSDSLFRNSLVYDFLTGITFAFAFNIFPKALDQVGISTRWIGAVFALDTAIIVLTQLKISSIVGRLNRVSLMQVHLALFGIGFVFCAVATAHASYIWAAFVAAVPLAFGECILGVARNPMISDMAPTHLLGRYNAASSTIFQAGMAIGSPIGAFALSKGEIQLWTIAIITCTVGVAQLFRLKSRIPFAFAFSAHES